MEDIDAKRLEFSAVGLTPGTNKIIYPDNLQVGTMLQQRLGKRAADKTANTSD